MSNSALIITLSLFLFNSLILNLILWSAYRAMDEVAERNLEKWRQAVEHHQAMERVKEQRFPLKTPPPLPGQAPPLIDYYHPHREIPHNGVTHKGDS